MYSIRCQTILALMVFVTGVFGGRPCAVAQDPDESKKQNDLRQLLMAGARVWDEQGKLLPVITHESFRKSGPGKFVVETTYHFIAPLPEICTVSFPADGVSVKTLSLLAHFPRLKHLSVVGIKVGRDEAELIGRLPLRSLDLSECRMEPAALKELKQVTGMRELKIHGAEFDSLEFVRAMSQLESLDLGDTSCDDKGLTHLAGMKQLTVLDVAGTPVTEKGLMKLADSPLRRLKTGGDHFSEQTVRMLRTFPQLEHAELNYSGAKVDLAALVRLSGHNSIRSLSLGGSHLNQQICAAIAELPELRLLWIPSCGVDDNAAAHLQGMKQLKELGLENNFALTDRGLASLAKIRSLQRLAVRNTGVTAAGVAAFEITRPNV